MKLMQSFKNEKSSDGDAESIVDSPAVSMPQSSGTINS